MAFLAYREPRSARETDTFSTLHTDMSRLFNTLLKRGSCEESSLCGTQTTWSPQFDIKETNSEYVLKADLPGLQKGDVQISLNGDVLCIKGERKSEEKKEDEKSHWRERSYGYFERSFRAPADLIDSEKIRAEMKDGELTVYLSKKPELQKANRTIAIH